MPTVLSTNLTKMGSHKEAPLISWRWWQFGSASTLPIDTIPSDALEAPLVVQTVHGCLFSLNFQMGHSPYLKEREEESQNRKWRKGHSYPIIEKKKWLFRTSLNKFEVHVNVEYYVCINIKSRNDNVGPLLSTGPSFHLLCLRTYTYHCYQGKCNVLLKMLYTSQFPQWFYTHRRF